VATIFRDGESFAAEIASLIIGARARDELLVRR
jgi:hypothetical protein